MSEMPQTDGMDINLELSGADPPRSTALTLPQVIGVTLGPVPIGTSAGNRGRATKSDSQGGQRALAAA